MKHSWLSAAFLRDNSSCRFSVWAPLVQTMEVHLVKEERTVPMEKDALGYFSVTIDKVSAGCRYFFRPDGKENFPDPASNYQPNGVHDFSEVVDHDAFVWSDNDWRGLPFRDYIIYELHVGTFTPQGTFEAIIPKLSHLVDCGVNAIEIMPVSQFPGSRNWGYDGVFPYAVQNTYGGPPGLKKLVNECHRRGIAVVMDVVYNHLGPEGNYFGKYGPYFTNQYHTPWGDAINFDQEWSDGVRDYFVNNALYWFEYFHVDALRLDATHTVFDQGAVHFWQYLHERVRAFSAKTGRERYLIAESDLNSPRVINPTSIGGYGLTAQWLDDFHHALYTKLDEERKERYSDFGQITHLAKAYKEGFVFSGEYVEFRKRKYGASSAGIPGDRFVVFNANHDQVGNLPDGARLSMTIDFERLKLAAAALLFAPYIPLLFMGEEYGETTPFHYFISHSDPGLVEAVRKGRKAEFKHFKSTGEWLDPQDEKTFGDSVLNWALKDQRPHSLLFDWYKELINLRKSQPALQNFDKKDIEAIPVNENVLIVRRRSEVNELLVFLNLGEESLECQFPFSGRFRKLVCSRDSRWSESQTFDDLPGEILDGMLTLPGLCACLYELVMNESFPPSTTND
jgi:maltooligosyltrehalose trehalohydrolase